MEHEFTQQIKTLLQQFFGKATEEIYVQSPLIQYLNIKTRAATRGSKARGSFANLYAVYVLVEDYLKHGFDKTGNYAGYEGAKFTNLFQRQRELPFGSKLQNHALNHRMNEEFHKYFPQVDAIPIVRNTENNRYWFNEHLLRVSLGERVFNIAEAIIAIINQYIKVKQQSFETFIQTCERLKNISNRRVEEVERFIIELLAPNVDARIFEIVSYAILKYYYHDQTVYFGFELDNIEEENLILYKTGRTNANDGGIDFVMRPLGRFFQVTETLDVRKYFLDIDKIEHYPISFVIKSGDSIEMLRQKLEGKAQKWYAVDVVVKKYMDCIEEIINIPILKERFFQVIQEGHLKDMLDEIIKQSKVEFNY
jgi:hypothetical protein